MEGGFKNCVGDTENENTNVGNYTVCAYVPTDKRKKQVKNS